MASFVKNSISYNWKPNFCINTIFIDLFLTKSKPILTGILYRPGKYDFPNCLKNTFSDWNPGYYLLGGNNINLQPKGKEMFRKKLANTINKKKPHLTRKYLDFISHITLHK